MSAGPDTLFPVFIFLASMMNFTRKQTMMISKSRPGIREGKEVGLKSQGPQTQLSLYEALSLSLSVPVSLSLSLCLSLGCTCEAPQLVSHRTAIFSTSATPATAQIIP